MTTILISVGVGILLMVLIISNANKKSREKGKQKKIARGYESEYQRAMKIVKDVPTPQVNNDEFTTKFNNRMRSSISNSTSSDKEKAHLMWMMDNDII